MYYPLQYTNSPIFAFHIAHARTHTHTHTPGLAVRSVIVPSLPTLTPTVTAPAPPPPPPTIAPRRRASAGVVVAVHTRAASPPAREADTETHNFQCTYIHAYEINIAVYNYTCIIIYIHVPYLPTLSVHNHLPASY